MSRIRCSPRTLVAAAAGLAAGALVFYIAVLAVDLVQRGKQKRTVSDMRSVATAIESYRVDAGRYPTPPGGAGRSELGVLASYLEPTYIKRLPARDAWKASFLYFVSPDASTYSIASGGWNRTFEGPARGGPTTAFASDIWYSSGTFVQYPGGSRAGVEGSLLERLAPQLVR